MCILIAEIRIVINNSHLNYNRMKTLAKYPAGVYNATQKIPLGGMWNLCDGSLWLGSAAGFYVATRYPKSGICRKSPFGSLS